MDFGVTADLGGAPGHVQVNRLSGHGDHFQQAPGRRRQARASRQDHVVQRGCSNPRRRVRSCRLRVAHQLTDEERIALRFAGNALGLSNGG